MIFARFKKSISIPAKDDPETSEELLRIQKNKQSIFKELVTNGSGSAEMMRGSEEPDIDEDPNHWSRDRLKLFGFRDENGERK